MKNNFLESIGAALMAVAGPVHDAILGKKGPYLQSTDLSSWKTTEDEEAALPNGIGPYPVKTLYAYVGGTALVAILVCLLGCGKLGKKKPVRRRRAPQRKTVRRYKRRR